MTAAPDHAAASTKRRRRFALSALVLLATALVAGLGWAAWITRDQGRVFEGVTVGGKPLGGMTGEAAEAALQARAAQLARQELVLRTGDHDWIRSAAALGVSYDAHAAAREAYALGRRGWPGRRLVERIRLLRRGAEVPLPARLDEPRARAALEAIAASLAAGPHDASARLVDGQVEIVSEVPGGSLDLPKSLATLRACVQGERPGPISLPATVKRPRVTGRDLRGVNGVVAEFSTPLAGSSRNRIHNVTLSAQAVDGHVILPGEEFSYNKAVGPRTYKAGYRTAPILQRGELVPGTGGGACQMSSTLYNVALLANMKIVRRSHHSLPVRYVRAGLDATVVYGCIDLVVRNTTGGPLVIRAGVAKRRLWIKALGRRPAPEVRIERSSRRIPAGKAIERPDSALPAGEQVVERKARTGWRVIVTRIVGRGAEATRELISNDIYRPQPAVIRVGTAEPPADETPPEDSGEPAPAEGEASPEAPKKPVEIAQ